MLGVLWENIFKKGKNCCEEAAGREEREHCKRRNSPASIKVSAEGGWKVLQAWSGNSLQPRRIIESFELKSILKDHLVQLPCNE